MAYKLIITEHADELLNSLLYHLIYRLKNQQAAKHLPDEIDKIYTCLEKNHCNFRFAKMYIWQAKVIMKQSFRKWIILLFLALMSLL